MVSSGPAVTLALSLMQDLATLVTSALQACFLPSLFGPSDEIS